MTHDLKERTSELKDLLGYIRVPFVSTSYLKSLIQCCEQGLRSEFKQVLIDAFSVSSFNLISKYLSKYFISRLHCTQSLAYWPASYMYVYCCKFWIKQFWCQSEHLKTYIQSYHFGFMICQKLRIHTQRLRNIPKTYVMTLSVVNSTNIIIG